MNRIAATLRVDVTNQARNRLYVIGIGVALGIGFCIRLLVAEEYYARALPAFFLVGLGSTTYLFVAGMVLFEKSERTLDALNVTPLRFHEYLLSKIVTLTAFAVFESVLVLAVVTGLDGFKAAPLIAGMTLMGAMYTLMGFAQVVRYRTVTDFLIPGAVFVGVVVQLPLLNTFDVFPSPVWYLVPTHAPLLLMQAAFESIETWQWFYGFAYTGAVLLALWRAGRTAFIRHIVWGGRPA